MNAREALRAATGETHERLHRLPAFDALRTGRLDAAGYRDLLTVLHDWHVPLEAALAVRTADFARHAVPLAEHRRAARLRTDLVAMGTAPGDRPVAPVGWVDALGTAGLFGVFYVREGSTLGGRVLAKALDPLLGSDRAGRTFLTGDPGDGSRWHRTCDAVERVAAVEPDGLAALIHGARLAFDRFEQAMTGVAA